MISEKTKKNLETRYNCHISINYLCGTYDVFSLDGCHWDWAGTYRGLVSMLGQGQPEENLGQEKKMRAAALFFCCPPAGPPTPSFSATTPYIPSRKILEKVLIRAMRQTA